MNVFESFRAEIIIRFLVLCVCGIGAVGCDAGSDGDADPQARTATFLEADSADVSGTPPAVSNSPRIVFLGTSLTAGYGLEDPDAAYPARVQERIDAAGMAYVVVNEGVSGDTSAGGLARLEWILRQPLAVLVIELGANDGLRGQSPDALRRNLRDVITRTRLVRPEAGIVIAGMEAPPNLGPEYTAEFRDVFHSLATGEATALVPFLLDGVAGFRELNQSDGIHPTVEGHEAVADNVWAVLEGVLSERCAADAACGSTSDRQQP